MHVHRLDHVHVYARNPEASAQFYASHFGAERIGSTRTTRGETMQFLRLGGLALVLAPYPPGNEPGVPSEYADGAFQRSFGVAHFGLEVDDVAASVDLLRAQGVTVLDEPRENAGLRFAYVGAPDGAIVELLQYGGDWSRWLGAARQGPECGGLTERSPDTALDRCAGGRLPDRGRVRGTVSPDPPGRLEASVAKDPAGSPAPE